MSEKSHPGEPLARPVFVCEGTKLATFSCPHCHAHVHRGEHRCAQCKRDVGLMAQQLLWGPILFNRALAQVHAGRYDDARDLLHRTRLLLPDRGEPYMLLAKVEAYMGRYDQAEEWVQDAHDLNLVSAKGLKQFRKALEKLRRKA